MKKFNFTEKFALFTIRYRWILIMVFCLLSVACAVAIPFTKIVYDLTGYLPDESRSAICLQVLKDEFDDKGNTYAVATDVTIEEAEELVKILSEVEGVDKVIFDRTSSYNTEKNSAIFAITLVYYDSTQGCFDTMKRLVDVGDKYCIYYVGQSASSYFTKLETEASIFKIGIVIVIVILIMLLLTSRSYFELIPMLINFGVAVLLNMGTNFLFNGISYFSNLVSLVLQLALSIDYSVILLHRFEEERSGGLDPKAAAVAAQKKGIPEILSSSLTTIAGLGALLFMTLDIGVEMGLALAKGIVFSLLSVIFFMPALLVVFSKPLERSAHKQFLPNVNKPVKAMLKSRYVIVCVFIISVITAGVGQSFNNYSFSMNGGEKLFEAKDKAYQAGFGTMNTLVIVLPNDKDYQKQRRVAEYVSSFEIIDSCTAIANIQIADGMYLTDSYTKEELTQKATDLFSASEVGYVDNNLVVTAVTLLYKSYCDKNGSNYKTDAVPLIDLLTYVQEEKAFNGVLKDYSAQLDNLIYAKNNLTGENYVRMTFNINADVEDKKAFDLIKELNVGLKNYYEEFYMTGETVVCYDMSLYFPKDNRNISLFTLAFILLILLVTFKNALLPFLLVIGIQGGIWINFVIPVLKGNMLCFIGYLLITAVQMGATIDYAIVLTNRYLGIRDSYTDKKQAMADSLNAVFPTVITSGVILMVTGFALAVASTGVVSAMGSLLGIGTALSVLIVIFVMPSLLLVTEKLIDKCYFNKIFKKKERPKDS